MNKDEIEITQEMIEAGEDAIWATPGTTEAAGLFSPSDLVLRVYRAMRAIEPASGDEPKGATVQ